MLELNPILLQVNYESTRTSGAYGPLVLAPAEALGALRAPCHLLSCLLLLSFFVFFCCIFFCLFCNFFLFCLFVFLSFCLFAFLSFCHHYHNYRVHIYYHTNFCSNPTIFQFYHTFYHTFYHKFLPHFFCIFCHLYHNHGVHIYHHTNFLFQSDNFFNFYHTFLPHIFTTHFTTNFYHKPLPVLPSTPPMMFSVPNINTGKCFERP